MMYLIGQLAVWLLLTAGFAALAGWAYAAVRAEPGEAVVRRERDGLMRDLRAISAESAGSGVSPDIEREMDTLRRRADLDAARIAEMARSLANARDRAQEAAGRVAELERAADRTQSDADELAQLREEASRAPLVQHVVATPVLAEEAPLQAWRLRYFEQRVRYLENHARETVEPAPVEAAPVSDASDPTWEWRARTAEARATHLEQEVRASAEAPPADEAGQADEGPFAANAETDMLLRWRLLYLEKRVAHLQGERHADAPQDLATAIDSDEAEKWKWRARYLEARTRHLEQQLAAAPAAQAAPAPAPAAQPQSAPVAEPASPIEPTAPARPAVAPVRAPALAAARGGLPDDFTLIDGVSAIQQTTLNSLGIFHFEQIAAWTPANVAWVDKYLRLRGRITEEEWIEQAQDLAEHGVDSVQRVGEDQDA